MIFLKHHSSLVTHLLQHLGEALLSPGQVLAPCPAQEGCEHLGTACYSGRLAIVPAAPTPCPGPPTSAICNISQFQASRPLLMLLFHLECSLHLPFFLLQTPILALKLSLYITSARKSSLTSLTAGFLLYPPMASRSFSSKECVTCLWQLLINLSNCQTIPSSILFSYQNLKHNRPSINVE